MRSSTRPSPSSRSSRSTRSSRSYARQSAGTRNARGKNLAIESESDSESGSLFSSSDSNSESGRPPPSWSRRTALSATAREALSRASNAMHELDEAVMGVGEVAMEETTADEAVRFELAQVIQPPLPSLLSAHDPNVDPLNYVRIQLLWRASETERELSRWVHIRRTAPMLAVRMEMALMVETVAYGVQIFYLGLPVDDNATPESLDIESGTIIEAYIDGPTWTWAKRALLSRKSPSTLLVALWPASAQTPPAAIEAKPVRASVLTTIGSLVNAYAAAVQVPASSLAFDCGGLFLATHWPLYLIEPAELVAALVAKGIGAGRWLKGKAPRIAVAVTNAATPRSSFVPIPLAPSLAKRVRAATATAPGPSTALNHNDDGDSITVILRMSKRKKGYRIKPSDKIGKAMALFADFVGVAGDQLRFVLDGDRLTGNELVEDLDLEDMDIIDAMP
ncbi:uncharacterized protein AMSG_05504 [Thecamonas trahens ATCC 50062]|uniref:Ubiquitin-like domain-containing protein n=1 Tax=Thecamonas trahens ATCC 50062 TaxID=461836 RepID=A0A0L0DDU8_THETB|nr:hypothetical protein AMSG_05504 [Thecamonas trahens ATCC 50062]KNC49488.1 hypothetical protein AMSG_05504 [Thecamonas trahens ATCC 50062]|eukprot:XP_013757907.1 hypothetical protein AMSG_05504 [Thecamonas trahens ATCC 50062]